MASTLWNVMGQGEQRGDDTAREQLMRAAGQGLREAAKGVVKEAIEETDAESRRSDRGRSRGLATLGLGAVAGYLVRDWQLRPDTYDEIEAEVAEIPETAADAREDDDEDGSWAGWVGRALGLALAAGVGYAMLRRRRRSRRGEQWTEERRQEAGGGLADEGGGDAGRMTGEPGEMAGGETETGETTSTSSEASPGGSPESAEDESSE